MWYTLETTTGQVILNFSELTRVNKQGSNQLRVYGGDEPSNGYIDYTLSSEAERDEIFKKIQSILSATNLNTLPPQSQ